MILAVENHDFSWKFELSKNHISTTRGDLSLIFSRNFILYHKLIPGKFQLQSSSFHRDKVEKPQKNDDFPQFFQLEKWWFWWIPKNRILESKMWNPKKNFKSCLLVVVYHHHEGYLCISSSYFRRGPTSWSFSWFSPWFAPYVPEVIYVRSHSMMFTFTLWRLLS